MRLIKVTEYGSKSYLSNLLLYITEKAKQGHDSLPSLSAISEELGMSVSKLREELLVARSFGLVEVKPRIGIKILDFDFKPAVSKSLVIAISIDKELFHQYSDLRNHIEASYWYQAVSHLNQSDIEELKKIIKKAFEKLNADPIQIPHQEHRQLHSTIYKRLENVFVKGLLASYWDIYEAVGLNVYEDRRYLDRVWNYHQQIVESISQSDYLSGYQALVAHMDLLFHREQKNTSIQFE
jgi:DNA-binding FadR family transcriptional regulator